MTNPDTMTKDQLNEAGAVELFGEPRPRFGSYPHYEDTLFPWMPADGARWVPFDLQTYEGMGKVKKALRDQGWSVKTTMRVDGMCEVELWHDEADCLVL